MKQPNLYADIETVPTQRAELRAALLSDVQAKVDAELAAVTAPSNYTDDEKIAAYIETKKAEIRAAGHAKADEVLRATALDGAFGEVYCIGLAYEEGPVTVLTRQDLTREAERALLDGAFSVMQQYRGMSARAPRLVGHNIIGFDLRFLFQRAIVHGLALPDWWPLDPKPWDRVMVDDTMTLWAGPRDRVSQSKLCRALGIADDDTIDGSQVWDCIKRGQPELVVEHCRKDVAKLRAIHQRIAAALPQ